MCCGVTLSDDHRSCIVRLERPNSHGVTVGAPHRTQDFKPKLQRRFTDLLAADTPKQAFRLRERVAPAKRKSAAAFIALYCSINERCQWRLIADLTHHQLAPRVSIRS